MVFQLVEYPSGVSLWRILEEYTRGVSQGAECSRLDIVTRESSGTH